MNDGSIEAPQIRAVLLDYGGVLADEGFRDGLYEIARSNGLNPADLHRTGLQTVYESGYVIGCGTEADFLRLLRSRANIRESDAELTEEIMGRFILRPWMMDIVRGLRGQGIRAAILSDQTDWLDRLDERDRFYREFDRVFVSYHLGKGKRDPSIFDDVTRELGVMPEQTIFVDDAPDNVDRAKSKGLKGILFTGKTEFLEELNRLLPRQGERTG